MPKSKLIGLVYDSWDDFDRVLNELTTEQAIENPNDESSFAWTLAHVTEQLDRWINVIAQDMPPHSDIGKKEFRFGGTGISEDWQLIKLASQEVRAASKSYLDNLTDNDLESILLDAGDPNAPHGISSTDRMHIKLYSVTLRIISHYYFHIGEIATKRDRIGHPVGDYPGPLSRTI